MSFLWNVYNHLQDILVGQVETEYPVLADARFEASQEFGKDSYHIVRHVDNTPTGATESFYEFPEWSSSPVDVSGNEDDCGLYDTSY